MVSPASEGACANRVGAVPNFAECMLVFKRRPRWIATIMAAGNASSRTRAFHRS
jgi:hypothetical protein